MEPGRLICVRKYQGDPATVAYVVALSESAPAKTVIQDRLGISPEDAQVYKQFVENESFKRFLSDMVCDITSAPTERPQPL
jgi:hypothetical protein